MTVSGTNTGRERKGSNARPDRPHGSSAARRHTRPVLPQLGGFWLVAGLPVAAVWRVPGPVGILGDHADRRLRRLRPRSPDHLADVRVGIGLRGPPSGAPRQSGDGRRRVRAVPGGGRCRVAVCRQGTSGRRRWQCDQRAWCRADRPAARGWPCRGARGGRSRRLCPA
jgi:hypothetical protein